LKTLRALTLVLLASLLVACQAPPQAPVRLVLNPWVGYDPFVLAREQDLLDRNEIRVVEMISYSETLRAFRNGLAEAVALTLDDALRLADRGVDLRIVLLLSESKGADAVLARPGIETPDGLRGGTVALEDTAVGQLVLDRMLVAGGLSRQDVTTSHVEAHLHAEFLRSGRIDAVITFEPMKSQLAAAGFPVVFDSRAMPGEIIDVLAVRPELPERRVKALRDAWQRGLAAMLADPDATAQLLAAGAGLMPQAYLDALDGLRFFSAIDDQALLTPESLSAHTGGLVELLLELELLRAPPDWGALLRHPLGPGS
jgi:NitT/TauT family transport system substrate-binding protein